ncbi:protein PSK SIMULATOR 1 [Phoenix dactylifera]|uniref:Protein PSK SIMULATOR 1 n=1 Tax=Phoenix dactylifera TaxID=42345 RepID=A0A8B7D583_PHODC|nr:protein PSK SIMULATOR 1 [Phoenix dactylifera]
MRKLHTESSWWLGRVGLARGSGRKKGAAAKEPERAAAIGVLAFEVASLMSKAVALWHSLGDEQIIRLRDEVLHLEGVRKLVSDDDDLLLGLALAEMMDSLASLSRSVARLGKRCADPVLQRFEHLFADLVKNGVDLHGIRYAGKKMERKATKMERLVAASSDLYQELEVLGELEQALRRMLAGADPGRRGGLIEFKQKVIRQRQHVKYLREASLWNRTYDYAVRLLARSLFTIVARVEHAFGFQQKAAADATGGDQKATVTLLSRSHSIAGLTHSSVHPSGGDRIRRFPSGPLASPRTRSGPIAVADRASGRQCLPHGGLTPAAKRQNSKTRWPVTGRPFSGCMVGGFESPVLQSCIPLDSGFRRSSVAASRIASRAEGVKPEVRFQGNIFNMNAFLSMLESRQKLLNAPESTLGAAALALHYANVIIVIEKLVASPHLIGPDARDDLYNMLPTSVRAALWARLKSYAKNMASSVYDPVLAAEWSEALTRILDWLSPLAHNMIRWQSERNFEHQHLVSSSNVLLLQTLYFANQMKTEAAITELLVGLNYLWRYGRELDAKAILECVSSRDLDDPLDSKD